MEEKLPSAGQSALYYGLLFGVGLVITHLVLYLIEQQKETLGIIISIAVMIIGIVIAQLDYRNKKWKGYITYGKAVKIGFLAILFASFIVAVYTYIYHTSINPGELLETKTEQIQKIYNQELDTASEEQSLKWIKYTVTPIFSAIVTIISYAIFGILISLITAIFIKKEESVSLS